MLRGDLDAGTAALQHARTVLVELGESAEVVETDTALILALLAADDAAAALDLAGDASERATAMDAGHLIAWLERLRGAALSDLGRLDEADEVLGRALDLADAHAKVERGFVLAEQSRVARRRPQPEAAETLARRSSDAFDELGFAGSARYPRD